MNQINILPICRDLLEAKASGLLGECVMPEDTNPGFGPAERELRLSYFTLPMALNYQRDSYKLWEAALKTYRDPDTAGIFDIRAAASMPPDDLRARLTKHKLALQPNKHVATWRSISETVTNQWQSFGGMFAQANYDFLRLRELVQIMHKKGFPYLSGPKIFNYWSFIIQEYGGISLKNTEHIEVAPDTHITKASIRLGLIAEEEATKITREEISRRWRSALEGSGITPIGMHPALWFWSRSGFAYQPQAMRNQ